MIDARDRVVMRYDYDMLGGVIHHASMEAGERWMLNDATGNAIRAFDSRGNALRDEYDALRRPLNSFLRLDATPEIQIGRTAYGESLPDPEARNLRGQIVEVFDKAGVATSEAFDFKGNLLSSPPPACEGVQEIAELVGQCAAGRRDFRRSHPLRRP